MALEENKRLAREAIKILTTGDSDAADALFAPNYVNHQHHDPEDPRDLHGVRAMKTFATEFHQKPSPRLPRLHRHPAGRSRHGGHALHVHGDPQGRVHGRGADEPIPHLDRDNHRPRLGGQDRRELGQLGHDGHDATAGRYLRCATESGLLAFRSIRSSGDRDRQPRPPSSPYSPERVEGAFSEVSSAPPNSQARLLSSSRCFARSAARLTAMVAKMTMSVTMTA